MRHFLGLIVGLAVTPLLLFGGGWAYQRGLRPLAQLTNPVGDGRALLGLAAMAGIGLIVGLIVATRVSPLATFIPSLALLGATVVYVLDIRRALDMLPGGDAGTGMASLLGTGIFTLLGIALFIPVLMPGRWSRKETGDELRQESYY